MGLFPEVLSMLDGESEDKTEEENQGLEMDLLVERGCQVKKKG